MSLLAWSKEVVAAGIGLDMAGAVFLGLSVLYSPLVVASHLLGDPNPVTSSGRPGISTQPVDHAVASMLQGRVGVICLLVGFGLQLIGLLLPSGGNHSGLPLAVAAIGFESARRIGVGWISRNWAQMEKAVWGSPRVTSVVDRQEALHAASGAKWVEPTVLRWIKKGFGPQWHQ